jgi:hypothetical protein
MDNINYITDNNLEKNLGNSVIQWFRKIKRNKKHMANGPVNSYQINQASETQYPDMLPVEIKNNDNDII